MPRAKSRCSRSTAEFFPADFHVFVTIEVDASRDDIARLTKALDRELLEASFDGRQGYADYLWKRIAELRAWMPPSSLGTVKVSLFHDEVERLIEALDDAMGDACRAGRINLAEHLFRRVRALGDEVRR